MIVQNLPNIFRLIAETQKWLKGRRQICTRQLDTSEIQQRRIPLAQYTRLVYQRHGPTPKNT